MNDLTYVNALVLGLLQGITEFLPISSSGHLALAEKWLHLEPESQSMILFDLAVHLGTLVAVVAVFAPDFAAFASRLTHESSTRFRGRRIAWPIAGFAIAASIPTAAVGLIFKDTLQQAFGHPFWIACGLIFTGLLLWTTGRIQRPRRGWRRFGVWRAVLVGLGQGLAITPGISRSGTTIAVAMISGLKRKWAGQFSFLIAVPAIGGAAMLEFKDAVLQSPHGLGALAHGPLWAGTLVATVSGYVALRILLNVLHRAKLHYFAPYCWALGIIVLVWSLQ